MKKWLSMLLSVAMLLCGLTAAADSAAVDLEQFSVPSIAVPEVPTVEAPETPDIDVPKVPTAAPTKKPRIEIPDIPSVDVPGMATAAPSDGKPTPAPTLAPIAPEIEAALQTLGEPAWRTTYDALRDGEVVADGSRGDAARGVQQLLVALGQSIAVDGIVGPKTLAALKAAQEQLGLPQTPSVDAEGFAALLTGLASTREEKP